MNTTVYMQEQHPPSPDTAAQNAFEQWKKATLQYTTEGRSGNITYQSPDSTFSMWWEYAGGDALVIVNIPNELDWPNRTQLPPEWRDHLLGWMAERIVRDRASGRRYTIDENFITIY
jgi:hypothetical protein